MKMIQMMLIVSLVGLSAYASPLPQKADLLASNTVVARYEGTQHHPCRHMTALCPDRCNHAATLAHFRVLRNERYQKSGEYGDERINEGDTALVEVFKDTPGQDTAVADFISRLKPGDVVRFTMNHYYVQDHQTLFPVRPVVHIEVVETFRDD